MFGGDAPSGMAEWSVALSGADPARLLVGQRLAPSPAVRMTTGSAQVDLDLDGRRARITLTLTAMARMPKVLPAIG